jgi:hypothetical protein
MRVLVGVFLVLSGVTLAVMGVRGTATLSSVAEPLRSLASLVAMTEAPSSGLAISAVVTLPAKVPKMEEPSTLAVAVSAPPTAESLVHGLQRELTRVGCYEGASDGIWNASTRRAMAAFIERVNAKLPITKPDPVLLALVQGHQGLACGSCPAGHESSADGRCLPKMIVAWATTDGAAPAAVEAPPPPTASGDKRLPAGTARQKKAARGADRSPPIEGRMSIGATTVTPLGPQAAREKLAAAEPFPSGPQSAQQLRRERRATRHGRRHVAALRSRGYLRPMRPVRYAFRPFRGGLAALFFGF